MSGLGGWDRLTSTPPFASPGGVPMRTAGPPLTPGRRPGTCQSHSNGPATPRAQGKGSPFRITSSFRLHRGNRSSKGNPRTQSPFLWLGRYHTGALTPSRPLRLRPPVGAASAVRNPWAPQAGPRATITGPPLTGTRCRGFSLGVQEPGWGWEGGSHTGKGVPEEGGEGTGRCGWPRTGLGGCGALGWPGRPLGQEARSTAVGLRWELDGGGQGPQHWRQGLLPRLQLPPHSLHWCRSWAPPGLP